MLAAAPLALPARGAWRRPAPVGWAAGALLLAVAASAALADHPAASVPSVALVAGYAVAAWLMATRAAGGDFLPAALRALFWGAVPWAALGITVALARVEWSGTIGPVRIVLGTWDHRANSVFAHPNLLSGYLILAMAAGLARAQGRWRLYGPGLGILAACQVLTYSRAGWLGTVVLLALFTFATPGRSGERARKYPTSMVIAGCVAGALALPFALPRALTVLDPAHPSNLGRLRAWAAAMRMVAERPLQGWGPGAWPAAYPRFRDPGDFEDLRHAHSLYLHLAAEFGLVATALFLAIVGALAFRAMATARGDMARAATALGAGLAGYLAMGGFDFTLSEGRNGLVFAACLGLLAATGQWARRGEPAVRGAAPALADS